MVSSVLVKGWDDSIVISVTLSVFVSAIGTKLSWIFTLYEYSICVFVKYSLEPL